MTEWYIFFSCMMYEATSGYALLWQARREWEHTDIRSIAANSTDCSTNVPGNTGERIFFFFFLFFPIHNGRTISSCEVSYLSDVFIGSASFSWCAEGGIFAHTCVGFSVLLVDTVESPQGETSSRAVIPAETRGSATSHLMISCDKKKRSKDCVGLTMEASLTDGSRDRWCIRMT